MRFCVRDKTAPKPKEKEVARETMKRCSTWGVTVRTQRAVPLTIIKHQSSEHTKCNDWKWVTCGGCKITSMVTLFQLFLINCNNFYKNKASKFTTQIGVYNHTCTWKLAALAILPKFGYNQDNSKEVSK